MESQQLFEGEDGTARLVDVLKGRGLETMAGNVSSEWDASTSGMEKWTDVKAVLEDQKKSYIIHQIVFTFTYPRLDEDVSKMRNHLLKAPFCVHPGTGRVCVPFDAATIEDFDPFNSQIVPHVDDLANQVNDHDANAEAGGETGGDAKKTHMKAGLAVFEKFLDGIFIAQRKDKAVKARDADAKLDF